MRARASGSRRVILRMRSSRKTGVWKLMFLLCKIYIDKLLRCGGKKITFFQGLRKPRYSMRTYKIVSLLFSSGHGLRKSVALLISAVLLRIRPHMSLFLLNFICMLFSWFCHYFPS